MSWIEDQGVEVFESFNLSELAVDQAWLNISNGADKPLWIYQLSPDCYQCPYKRQPQSASLLPGNSAQVKISTKFPTTSFLFATNGGQDFLDSHQYEGTFCHVEASLGEFGVYDLVASSNGKCLVETRLEPVNIYFPLIICAIFYILLTIVILLWGKYKQKILNKVPPVLQKLLRRKNDEDEKVEPAAPNPKPASKLRLKSLDTFRGLCIIVMIFVNDGGAQYYMFEHATWDGLTIGDLVFPWFLWIMGVCIPISIKSQLKRKTPNGKIFQSILIRSLKLLGLGLILASKRGPVDIKNFRLPGVLQRFAFCYFAAASMMLVAAESSFVQEKKYVSKFLRPFQDIMTLWKGWILAVLILLVHFMLTFYLPISGCPTGYLGPGGLHLFREWEDYPDAAKCIGGAAGYIDRQILTISHIFRVPTAKTTYESDVYDPEGILGTLTSIFQVWLGIQCGLTLITFSNPRSRLLRWMVWAVITGGFGGLLCSFSQFGGWIPLNKNLWSISYVLVTTSFALILLSFLYIIVDLKKWWNGTPFLEPGMNSILLYVAHSVCYVMLPFHFIYMDKLGRTHFQKLVESLWGTSVWVLIAIYLKRIRYFWTL